MTQAATGPTVQVTDVFARLLTRETKALFTGNTSASELLKKLQPETTSLASAQKIMPGRRPHPFNMRAVKNMLMGNIHHAACIHAKVSAVTGLGFVLNTSTGNGSKADLSKGAETADELLKQLGVQPGAAQPNQYGLGGKTPGGNMMDPTGDAMRQAMQSQAEKILNPLCRRGFNYLLSQVSEDFQQVGSGYIEVVREGPGGKIIALHYVPAETVYINVMDDQSWTYELCGNEGYTLSGNILAAFGESALLASKTAEGKAISTFGYEAPKPGASVSEIIHFSNPSSIDRFYGFPYWLAAVVTIELNQCVTQHKYDFFLNRGVPEFLLFILGKKLPPKDWKVITDMLDAQIGLQNSHKSVAMNIEDPDVKVQLEKLAMEGAGMNDGFNEIKDVLALDVIAAHRVPPLIAGIVLPGRIGSANELPNALMLFHLLVAAPDQKLFHTTLGMTLGNSVENAGLGLQPEDFVFKRIIDEMQLGQLAQMATIGGMRQTLPEAQAQGRDLNAGMKN